MASKRARLTPGSLASWRVSSTAGSHPWCSPMRSSWASTSMRTSRPFLPKERENSKGEWSSVMSEGQLGTAAGTAGSQDRVNVRKVCWASADWAGVEPSWSQSARSLFSPISDRLVRGAGTVAVFSMLVMVLPSFELGSHPDLQQPPCQP